MFPGGLKTLASLLVRRNTRGPRSWTSCCFNKSLIPTTTSPPLAPIHFFSRLTFSNPACTALFFPLRHHRCLPLTGPLFLSSPASKLSQSATPLYLRGKDDAIFPIDLPRLAMLQLMVAGLEHQTGTLPLSSSHPAVVEDSFLNLPNFISITRMLSGPLIAWMVMNEWYLLAFCGLVISGATDWLDGFLARKMNINSVYGSYLDPLADKVLIGCVALAMVEKNLLHPGLVWLVVLRDVGLVSGAVYKRASSLGWEWRSWSDFVNLDATHRRKVEPLLISKVNTVLQLLLVAAALLQPEFDSRHSELYITYLSWLVASTTIASAYSYGAHHLQNTKTLVTPK